jgi:cytochrome c peroxidase
MIPRWTAAALTAAAVLASGCGSTQKSCARRPLPPGALPDLSFDGVDEQGAPASVALRDYFEPCAASPRLLVIRISAAWCGTCRWHAAHTGELRVDPRVQLLDLLLADASNAPATVADLAAWRARIDAPGRLAVDAARLLDAAPPRLPRLLLVDTRTLSTVATLDDPDPDALVYQVRAALAALDGAPAPAEEPAVRIDDRFTREEWGLVQEMTMPGAPPPDPSNSHADDDAAAALGKQLFFDTALSPSGKVACASCHDPQKQLSDQLPRSTAGVAPVLRNAPAIALAPLSPWQFWDGRADSLWMQALGPLEAGAEFGSSRLFVDHVIASSYRAEFEAIWGALPDLADTTRFPSSGKPGSPEWTTMTPEDQSAATRVFVDVGKSIASYERKFRVQSSAVDQYAAGDLSALSATQKDGLAAFFRAGCAQCHFGPRLTDDAFHVVGLPSDRTDGTTDRGRIDGVALLLGAEFNSASPWSDAPQPPLALTPASSLLGAFKTPTLRGAPASAPYGHAGTSPTLEDVVGLHGNVQAQSPLLVGQVEPWLPPVDAATQSTIAKFLGVLTADPIVP